MRDEEREDWRAGAHDDGCGTCRTAQGGQLVSGSISRGALVTAPAPIRTRYPLPELGFEDLVYAGSADKVPFLAPKASTDDE